MRRFICLSLIALIFSGCAFPGIAGNKGADDPAPYFELLDLNGDSWNTDDLKGSVVMLYFWSATCPPCIEKLGDLAILQDQLPEGTELLLINPGDSEQRIRQLVADYPNLNVLLDGRGVFARYQVRFTPTTVFIDSNGRLADSRAGAMENADALEFIDNLN